MTKKKIYCIFDTETIGLEKKYIYDLGMVITRKRENPMYKKRWIIKETMEVPSIERIAYYGDKISTFYQGMERISFSKARTEFNQIMEFFQVDVITAYNLQFDISALSQTMKWLSLGNKFLNRKIEYFDLWDASCSSFFQQKQFKEIAIRENWLSNAGNFRTSAEIAYRFITRNYQFIESHTALEDASIETKILQEVFRQKKGVNWNKLVGHPWRKVQRR